MQVTALNMLTDKVRFAPEVERVIGQVVDLKIEKLREQLFASQQATGTTLGLKSEIYKLECRLSAKIAVADRKPSTGISKIAQVLLSERNKAYWELSDLRVEAREAMTALESRLGDEITAIDFVSSAMLWEMKRTLHSEISAAVQRLYSEISSAKQRQSDMRVTPFFWMGLTLAMQAAILYLAFWQVG